MEISCKCIVLARGHCTCLCNHRVIVTCPPSAGKVFLTWLHAAGTEKRSLVNPTDTCICLVPPGYLETSRCYAVILLFHSSLYPYTVMNGIIIHCTSTKASVASTPLSSCSLHRHLFCKSSQFILKLHVDWQLLCRDLKNRGHITSFEEEKRCAETKVMLDGWEGVDMLNFWLFSLVSFGENITREVTCAWPLRLSQLVSSPCTWTTCPLAYVTGSETASSASIASAILGVPPPAAACREGGRETWSSGTTYSTLANYIL